MQLSKNFTLEEFLRSEKAEQLCCEDQYKPSAVVISNLTSLCLKTIQPLRDIMGHSIKVNSGYRCKVVNDAVKSTDRSQHLIGQAADLRDTIAGNKALFMAVLKNNLPFGQLIWEHGDDNNPDWVHISYSVAGNKGEILRINDKGKFVLDKAKILAADSIIY